MLAPEKLEAVGSEIADVLHYLVQLSNVLGIDPVEAAQAKIKLNAQKYPVDKAKGTQRHMPRFVTRRESANLACEWVRRFGLMAVPPLSAKRGSCSSAGSISIRSRTRSA